MIDLSNDRKSVEIQILGFIRKEQVVPFRVLQHYAHLLTIEAKGGVTSSGGSGSQTSTANAADIQEGINTSVDIDTIISELQKQNTSLEEIEAALSGTDATDFSKASGFASGTVIEVVPAKESRKEFVFQNKDERNFIYLTLGVDDVTEDLSFTVPPLGVIGFDSLKAQQRITAVTKDNSITAKFYYEEVE